MAGTHPFVTRVRAVLKGLDDEALAALANKGLLRRGKRTWRRRRRPSRPPRKAACISRSPT